MQLPMPTLFMNITCDVLEIGNTWNVWIPFCAVFLDFSFLENEWVIRDHLFLFTTLSRTIYAFNFIHSLVFFKFS